MAEIIIDVETLPRPVPKGIADWKLKKLIEDSADELTARKKYDTWVSDKWLFDFGGSRPIVIGVQVFGTNEVHILQDSNEEFLAQKFSSLMFKLAEAKNKIIGFNIKSFDLPCIMTMCAKYKVPMGLKFGKWDVIDLMIDPPGCYGRPHSLAFYAEQFALGEKSGNGADVAKLWAEDLENKTTQVADYCRADVRLTTKLYGFYRSFYNF